MKNKVSLLLVLALCSGSLLAQPLSSSSYETKIRLGEEAMALKNYAYALEQYEEAWEEREDMAIVPILAEINYEIRDYRQAERWYRRILRRDDENAYAELRYNYGRVLKMQGKHEEATEQFQRYLEVGGDDATMALVRNELTGSELAQSMPGNAQGVVVEALDRRTVNSPQSEYTPNLSPDLNTLYFAAFSGKDIITADDANDPEQYSRIFMSTMTDKGFGERTPLGPEVNRPGFHNVNVSLSPDGNRMYFNRIVLQGNVPGASKIYMSERGAGEWKSANEVEGVNGEYLALQPAVGELFGEEVLYFVSDMEGGYGGMDIYYAPYEGDGQYGDPVNLGETINTSGNEMTPWWFDGTLYYSTDGLATLGGLDIFYSVWNGSNWSDPSNMGKAYNTEADELSFRLFDEGYRGFFTSNRPEGRAPSGAGKTCCDDIYSFAIARLYADLVVGTFDEPNREPLTGATVQLFDETGGEDSDTKSLTMATGNRFDFGLNLDRAYSVIVSHPDYYPDTVTFNTLDIAESRTFEERVFLLPKPKPPVYDTITIENPIVLENILYEFDDDRITESAESDLQVIFELLEEYPEMKIEMGSHTDIRGEDNYNRDLSQRRAESARRWLVRKGVDRNRIQAQGYGETVPQVVNDKMLANHPFLSEGDILTEDFINALGEEEQQEAAHQLNRRTEFKIIEGPTSIIIQSTRLRKQEGTDRGSNIGSVQTPPDVHPMSSLYGQENLRNVPIMEFKHRSFTLGTVPKGETREFQYEFTNRGDTDLVIDLISACDCTTTDYSTRPYKPGETGVIKVVFDSSEKDEAETIDVDVYLRNNDNQGNFIIEMLNYSFEIEE